MVQYKGAFVLGALIGAGLGVLLAPDKGSKIREDLKKEGKSIKDQFISDFEEVTDDLSKVAKSGKEKFDSEFKNLRSKTSYKAEKAITFLERQLAKLKEKNKTYQQTT